MLNQRLEFDKYALHYLRNKKHILDIGCGEGRFLAKLGARGQGIDHNPKSVQICKEKGLNAKQENILYGLSFSDESFDGVIVNHVIEHLFPQDAHKLLKEANRILKKDGILIISSPLMYDGFFNDFTHIKPYPPRAILHYMGSFKQRTLDDIEGSYSVIKTIFRYRFIRPLKVDNILKKFIYILCSIAYRIGIRNKKKTGYMLMLQKLR